MSQHHTPWLSRGAGGEHDLGRIFAGDCCLVIRRRGMFR